MTGALKSENGTNATNATNGKAMRWTQVPATDRTVLIRGKTIIVLEEEIGTRQAAELLGISQRWMQALCDEGLLREGVDWRKGPGTGRGPNTVYHLKLNAVMELRQRGH